ncbi:TPA: hypothetical protein DCX16_00240 [bacterium]|nr:hypothetical protein [bacterium]
MWQLLSKFIYGGSSHELQPISITSNLIFLKDYINVLIILSRQEILKLTHIFLAKFEFFVKKGPFWLK